MSCTRVVLHPSCKKTIPNASWVLRNPSRVCKKKFPSPAGFMEILVGYARKNFLAPVGFTEIPVRKNFLVLVSNMEILGIGYIRIRVVSRTDKEGIW